MAPKWFELTEMEHDKQMICGIHEWLKMNATFMLCFEEQIKMC